MQKKIIYLKPEFAEKNEQKFELNLDLRKNLAEVKRKLMTRLSVEIETLRALQQEEFEVIFSIASMIEEIDSKIMSFDEKTSDLESFLKKMEGDIHVRNQK